MSLIGMKVEVLDNTEDYIAHVYDKVIVERNGFSVTAYIVELFNQESKKLNCFQCHLIYPEQIKGVMQEVVL